MIITLALWTFRTLCQICVAMYMAISLNTILKFQLWEIFIIVIVFFFIIVIVFFFFLPSPNLGLTPPGLTTQIPMGRGSNSLWTRTLERYTRAGLPECVVSTMSGPLPGTAHDKTQKKDIHPIPGQKLKFLTPPRIEPGPPDWKAGTLPTTPRRRGYTYFSSYNSILWIHITKWWHKTSSG